MRENVLTKTNAWDEWVITRNDKPILFGVNILGPTWVDEEIVFNRPIEKLGSNLKFLWNGHLMDDDKTTVTRLVAHVKKSLNRKARTQGKKISDIILTCAWEDSDF